MMDRIANGAWLFGRFKRNPVKGPKMAFITGGTGSRFIAMELRQATHNAAYIIGTADSGGSTRALRLLFAMPAIGDFRSRLIDLADRSSPGYKETTALLNYRLPGESTPDILEEELASIINGSHPLIRAIIESEIAPNPLARIIRHALHVFQTQRLIYEKTTGQTFDLRKASIGNLFLAGSYFEYEKDLETPIFLYKQIAGVAGSVIPAMLDIAHVAALMADHSSLFGQHRITASDCGPVKRLWYVDGEAPGSKVIQPAANPGAIAALRDAKLIVFAMGSFYTSILSVLLIPEIAQVIRESSAPKILITNPVQDEETVGMRAGDFAAEVIKALTREGESADTKTYLTHILVNDPPGDLSFVSKYGGEFPFVDPDVSTIAGMGIETIRLPLLHKEGLKMLRNGTHMTQEQMSLLKKYDSSLLAKLLFSFV